MPAAAMKIQPTCGCCGGPRSIYSAAWCKDCYRVASRPTQFKPVPPPINYEQLEIVLAEMAARDERDRQREILRHQRTEERRAKIERKIALIALREAEAASRRFERAKMFGRMKAARDLARARRTAPSPASLSYPYVRVVTEEHSDLMLVNSIVPRAMEGREDVCQELMIALWEKRITIADLRANKESIRGFMSAFRRDNFESGGYAISLDQPMRDGRSWHDVLVDPAMAEDIEIPA